MASEVDVCEARLFGDGLTCMLSMPVSLRPAEGPADMQRAANATDALLRSLAQVENHQAEDAPDEHSVTDLALQRLEAKLDLTLALLGRLLVPDAAAVVRTVRWSWRGLSLTLPGDWKAGDAALFSTQAASWLPQRLELPVRVLHAEPDGDARRLWLAVEPLEEGLAESLQRYLFRLHRRAVAEERRSR
ncbi:MAG: PilZ domain-containing protein [Pseudomonadota bacterium]